MMNAFRILKINLVMILMTVIGLAAVPSTVAQSNGSAQMLPSCESRLLTLQVETLPDLQGGPPLPRSLLVPELQTRSAQWAFSWRKPGPLRVAVGPRRWANVEPSTPVHAIQKISMVIPVFKEFHNGNLARIVAQLKSQTVNPGLFRLVVVVNNTKEVAVNVNHPALIENKASLAWLARVKSELPFEVVVVDRTAGIERNIGRIRNEGVFAALNSTDVPYRNHVIANMDADTLFPRDYFEGILAYYNNYSLDALFLARKLWLNPADRLELFQTYFDNQSDYHVFDLHQALGYPLDGVSTPQITARGSVLHELGAFPPLEAAEDLALAMKLIEHRRTHAVDLVVMQQDRARPESYDGARRAEELKRSKLSLASTNLATPSLNSRARRFRQWLIEVREQLAWPMESLVAQGRGTCQAAIDEFCEVISAVSLGELKPSDLSVQSGYAQMHEELYMYVRSVGARLGLASDKIGWLPFAVALPKGYLGQFMAVGNVVVRWMQLKASDDERSLWAKEMQVLSYRHGDAVRARLQDLAQMIRGESLTSLPVSVNAKIGGIDGTPSGVGLAADLERTELDPFRLALRIEGSPLQEFVLKIIKEGNWGYQSPEAMIAVLQYRLPDWLEPTWEMTPFKAESDVFGLLVRWVLQAQQQPEAFPGVMWFISTFGFQRD